MRRILLFGAFAVLLNLLYTLAQSPQTTITLQTKSYIARMVTPQSEQQGKPDDATTKALGFEQLVGGRVQAYELMLLTDQIFRENPTDGTKETDQFRLWSKLQITGKCSAGKIVRWAVSEPEIAFGKEGALNATGEILTPLKVQPSASGNTSQSTISFRYAIKGRPHALATPAFENIQPRQCYWIWHEISGTASCSGNTFTVSSSVSGSQFPSHRLWQNGKLVSEITQGPFDNLWKCGTTPGLVK
jgi:hypothetical protein